MVLFDSLINNHDKVLYINLLTMSISYSSDELVTRHYFKESFLMLNNQDWLYFNSTALVWSITYFVLSMSFLNLEYNDRFLVST